VALSSTEAKRKTLHIAVGAMAMLLRFLSWPQAALMAAGAFVFNWQLLPRLGGKGLWRPREIEKGYPLGVLLYPLSVLGLILAFREELWKAAAVWGILSLGDGAASLFGQLLEGPRLAWNPRKGWAGLIAFFGLGALGSSFLAAWTLGLPLSSWASPRILVLTLPLSLVCALVETLPTTLDDNVTVPLVGGVVLALLSSVEFDSFWHSSGLAARALLGLGLNVPIAAFALWMGSIDASGAASAILIGTLITAGLSWQGLTLMVVFFGAGTFATKLGYRLKAQRGIAQEKGGARGWRNAWANGGIPALLAVLAGAHAGGRFPSRMGSGLHSLETSLLFTVAYAASVATAAADTCSSEMGKAYGRRTFLITTLREVAPGTEGAVSLEGTLAGLAGSTLVAWAGAATGLYPSGGVPFVALAGLLGSLAESLIGTVAERKGWLNNDLLNALNTAIGAAIGWGLARLADAFGMLGAVHSVRS